MNDRSSISRPRPSRADSLRRFELPFPRRPASRIHNVMIKALAGCVHGTHHDSDSSAGDGRTHGRSSGHRTLGRARSDGWDAAGRSATSPAGRAKGELGSPGDPVRVATTVSQRQFGPRPGGRKISRMAAALCDRFLPKQGSFPLADPPGAGRGLPQGVRVSDSAVVAEGPLDEGQSEPLGVQK